MKHDELVIERRPNRRDRRGVTLVLLLFMLPVVLGLAAFAINLSYMELNRTELRVSADAAARASGRTLAVTSDQDAAKAAGRDASSRNHVAGQPLQLDDSDFVFGESVRPDIDSRYLFTPGGDNPNAVEVTGRRTTGSLDGPVNFLFPITFGAGAFEVQQNSTSTQVEVDVALVIDRSGSMAYAANEAAVWPNLPAAAPPGWYFCDPVPPNSRWLDVGNAVGVFLNELTNSPANEMVALCTYSDSPNTDQELTSTYSNITAGLVPYTNEFCGGGTNVGGGINEAIAALSERGYDRPWAAKVIVVMTDGIHNTGMDPVDAAELAGEAGIMVFSVTFSDEADKKLMKKVAEKGAGQHFHASTGAELEQVFEEIAKSLPTLMTD